MAAISWVASRRPSRDKGCVTRTVVHQSRRVVSHCGRLGGSKTAPDFRAGTTTSLGQTTLPVTARTPLSMQCSKPMLVTVMARA
jgi:hypothetical protein